MDLTPLLAPASIAVIGASARDGSIGHELLVMIEENRYRGDVFPVNPRYSDIRGLKCFRSIEEIPQRVDLAVFVLSAQRLEQQFDAALQAGVRAMIITPNAILENDTEPKLAERIRARLREAEVPVSGYNSMGFYNLDLGLKACGFRSPAIEGRGGIAFVSQSGSVFSAITHNDPQLEFNLSINTGAELNVTIADYMLYALDQPTTRVIGLFVEAVRDPQGFQHALRTAAERRIPVVVLKVGKSELGARFTISHSGGLAGDDEAFNAVLRHYGAFRVTSMDELANTLLLFSYYREAPGGDVALIADSGGERSMICDEASRLGLSFADLAPETVARLAELQDFGQEAVNPLDPWGTGIGFDETLSGSMEVMCKDSNSAIGILSLNLRDDNFMVASCLAAFRHAKATVDTPLVHMTNYSGVRRRKTTDALNALGVPVLCGTRATLKAVRHWLNFRDFKLEGANGQCDDITVSGEAGDTIAEYEALNILRGLGMPAVECIRVESEQDLLRRIEDITYPAVLKTMRPGCVHKSDAGGVVTGIGDRRQLMDAYRAMANTCGDEALIQPMMQIEAELMLGMKTDEIFGPLVVLGAGGIFTEQIRDAVAMLPTAGKREIEQCLRGLRVFNLMQGARGTAPADVDAIVKTVLQFSRIVRILHNRVAEIDINPLAICGSKPIALDALIVRS